jgi:phosphoribosylaminoimidazole carboxylase
MDSRTCGILGGGQLGRMIIEAGNRIGVRVAILDPGGSSSPAGQLAELCIEGSFKDASKIRELASVSDVMTVEIEHVNTEILDLLVAEGKQVHPRPSTIRMIQDKYLQKVHLAAHNIALPPFMDVPDLGAAREAGLIYGYPYMLKNKKLAYDGKGNAIVKSEEELSTAFEKLGGFELYAEKWVLFVKELAVMVVQTQSGTTQCYPVVETIQKDNICHIVIAPAQISQNSINEALNVAKSAISCMPGAGIYGVELFLLPDDTILLNEIAPRPHNSGHYTMEACEIDQFEMHLRAVMNLPCPIPKMKVGVALMLNILGASTNMEETKAVLVKALGISGAGIHWYGKAESRIGRKMAHLTITGDDFNQLRERVELLGLSKEEHGLVVPGPRIGIIMGSDSDLPTMKDSAEILDYFGVSYELTVISAHRTPTRMYSYAQSAVERGLQVIIAGAGGAAHLPGMVAALTSLPVIGVPIKTSTMNGQDSLYSIVQMPKGIPVATVAIGNAANAGLLAVRILASQDKKISEKMDLYIIKQEEEVLKKATYLESVGYANYLSNMK